MSHDDTSYYEIALTTRQVVVFFVVLLVFVITVFLSGVWVGKSGGTSLADGGRTIDDPIARLGADEEASADDLDNVEELRFFDENDETLETPDLSEILDTPRTETTLAQDVGSQARGGDSRAEDARTAPNGPSRPQRSDPPPRAAAPPPPPPPTPASPTAGERFVIQVFSTRDEAQAQKVLQQLRGGGHRAFLSPVEVSGSTMHRVRVGPFGDRARADQVATEITRKFRLDTWVTAAGN